MAEMSKEECLTNLYALRAGLSVASEIADGIMGDDDEIYKVERVTIPQKERSIAGDNPFTQERKRKESDIQEFLKQKESHEKRLKTNKKRHKQRNICLQFLYAFLLMLCVGILGANETIAINRSIMEICFAGGTLGALVTGIVLICKREDWFGLKKRRKDCEESLKDAQKQILAAQKKCKELEKQEREEIAKNKEEIAGEQLTIQKKSAEIGAQKQALEKVYGALREQFGSFLDERDWRNVDLIIYTYETGRALDLRDALLQVDKERRNERLVEAIEEATSAITYTIERGFGAMQRTFEQKMDKLNDTFVKGIAAVNNNLVASFEQNRAIKESMEQVLKISSAQEALQRKMSVSSDQMADDIAYVRKLEHNKYYGINP